MSKLRSRRAFRNRVRSKAFMKIEERIEDRLFFTQYYHETIVLIARCGSVFKRAENISN